MFRLTRFQAIKTAAVRSMSTKHEPPKKIHGLTGRYAMATFTAASKANALSKVEEELLAVQELLRKNAAVAQFFQNPTVPRADKHARVSSLISEDKFSNISRNLMLTLAANGRLSDASKVIAAYEELMQASRGTTQVTIISSEALKKKQLDQITAAIQATYLQGGKGQVEVSTKVDEGLLGGLQVQIGDRFLDLSVASRIASLGQVLESAH
eukprot:gene28536-34446_t